MALRALVIDDEAPLRNIINEVMKLIDIECLQAGDGDEALALAEENKGRIDLIMLDMNMPVMSGEDTYRRLHAMMPQCPVIFMSGFDDESDFSDLELPEKNMFLKKPFTIMKLKDDVSQLLNLD